VANAVEIVGVDTLAADFAKLCAKNGPLNKSLSDAGVQAARPAAAATRAALPQDTGRLSGDVRVDPTWSGAAVRMGRPSIRYAGFVEFGGTRKTPHTSTRPYQSQGRYLWLRALGLSGAAGPAYETATAKALDSFNWTTK
jgi:hypothetical protein